MAVAGIDYSTRAVDVVLLDEDTDAAEWHRFELDGSDNYERTRSIRTDVPHGAFWDDVLAVGIERPYGPNKGTLLPIFGALLTVMPRNRLVQPLSPAQWRKTVGLPGNASKTDVRDFALGVQVLAGEELVHRIKTWPQDACDAYCIALATRTLLEHKDAA